MMEALGYKDGMCLEFAFFLAEDRSAQSSKVPGDVLGENLRESLLDWETDAA